MPASTEAPADLTYRTATGTWSSRLTGSESGHDDDGSMWTMQTWLITTPAGETLGTFARDLDDARTRLAAIAY